MRLVATADTAATAEVIRDQKSNVPSTETATLGDFWAKPERSEPACSGTRIRLATSWASNRARGLPDLCISRDGKAFSNEKDWAFGSARALARVRGQSSAACLFRIKITHRAAYVASCRVDY